MTKDSSSGRPSKDSITKSELEARLICVQEELNSVWRERTAEAGTKENQITECFRQRLVTMRNRFHAIFESDSGSTYFVLDSGESLRIQRRQERLWRPDVVFTIHKIFDHIRFASQKEVSRMIEIASKKYGTFMHQEFEGNTLALSELCEGVHPIEFRDAVPGQIESTRKATLVFTPEVVGSFAHLGHPVSRIIP